MILNSIQGILTDKQDGYACCLVGGVEWQLAMSRQGLSQLSAVGERVRIYTQLKLGENSIALYGFARRQERVLFGSLISVPGIGPKLALGLLSKASVEELASSIIRGDVERLTQLPGLGSKTAQKLILQLGDKLEKLLLLSGVQPVAISAISQADTATGDSPGANTDKQLQRYQDLLAALVAMGYEERRSHKVLDQLFDYWQTDRDGAEETAAEFPPEGECLRQAIVRLA